MSDRELDAIEGVRLAGVLLNADIACENGCSCEGYDYCAQVEWERASRHFDSVFPHGLYHHFRLPAEAPRG